MRRWNLVFLVVGLAALAVMIGVVGVDEIAGGLQQIGWGFALACGAHLGSLTCDAIALRACAGDAGRGAALWPFLRASLVAHAINTATPGASVGEALRYSHLRDQLGGNGALSAVSLLNLTMMVSTFALLAVGPLAGAVALGVRGPVAYALYGAAAVSAIAAVGAVVVIRRGVGGWPFALLRAVRIDRERVAQWRQRWDEVEAAWRSAVSDRRRLVTIAVAAASSRLANVLEVGVLLWLLGQDQVVPVALLATANATLVQLVTAMVPYGTGTLEGGNYLLFKAVGLTASVGVTVELARKARRVAFVVLGLGLLSGVIGRTKKM